jgi:hypothetical protein
MIKKRMSNTKELYREFARAVAHYCDENEIPFYYQILIQLGLLFCAGILLCIYDKIKESCQKEIKLKKIKSKKRKK